MKNFSELKMQSKELLSDLSMTDMLNTISFFNKLYRYTGYPAGESAAKYIQEKLSQYGVPYQSYEYDAFLSLPLSGKITIQPDLREINGIADVFSATAKNITGEIYYDAPIKKWLSPIEEEKRFSHFQGKIILTHSAFNIAKKAAEAGALALIHISTTKGGYVHHRGICQVWGSPCLERLNDYADIASLGISYEDGIMLVKQLEGGRVTVSIDIEMDTGIKRSTMPVAHIPGESEKYVLISGHYDSWYEGITDNAASDAIMLEFARVFWQHRNKLNRSIKIAWWSGHSDGRYAGSSWFCDHEWADLRKNCVAHLNLDLAGCKGADQIVCRTTLMEGFEFTASLIEEFTGRRPEKYIPMVRGADQSFFGVNVPIAIMPKYEPLPQNRVSSCPSGGPWWHTDQDTIDKLDKSILIRDAMLNGTLAYLIVNSHMLPVEMSGFTAEMKNILDDISAGLDQAFDLSSVYRQLEMTGAAIKKLENWLEIHPENSDDIIKDTAGELTRLVYSQGSRYYHDPAVEQKPFPAIAALKGLSAENCSQLYFLAAKNTFKRQCNRIIGQLSTIEKRITSFIK